jgi:hypothetical protein
MYCPNCGEKASKDMAFCPNCGEALSTIDHESEQPDSAVTASHYAAPPAGTAIRFVAPPASPYLRTSPPPPSPLTTHATTPVTAPAGIHAAPTSANSENSTETAPAKYRHFANEDRSSPHIADATHEKKPRATAIIWTMIFFLTLTVFGSFGYYFYSHVNSYNSALQSYEAAERVFLSARTSADYQTAEEQFISAYDGFSALGEYRDASEYAQAAFDRADRCRQNLDYLQGLELLDKGEFEAAIEVFRGIAGFKDSAELIELCQQNLQFQKGISLYQAEKYDAALEVFEALLAICFSEAEEWCFRTIYAIGGQRFKTGDYYGAWQAFDSIRDYAGATGRAEACKTALPATGELFRNPDFAASEARQTFNGSGLNSPRYIKIYSEDILVSNVFVNTDDTVTIGLPAGSYTYKLSGGNNWFGEEVMWGNEGFYHTLVFEDGNQKTLLAGWDYQLNLAVSDSESNVSNTVVDRESF